MAQRDPYNWSILDKFNLCDLLNKSRRSIVGKTLPIDEIHSILSTHIKTYLPVRVTSDRDAKTKTGHIYIGGVYHSDFDQSQQKQIEIILSYHTFDQKLTISQYKWTRICSVFADTVLHELIHMRQYRTRNFKTIPEYESTAQLARQRRNQQYYGHSDEIGAFSFNIACELYSKFGDNFNQAIEFLDSPEKFKRYKYSTYFDYLRAFDFDLNHKIIKKLKRKVIRNLPYAQIGKPFKTLDHLTY